MLEIPESHSLAGQLEQTVQGKTIMNVTAGHTPHKFTWYFGDPAGYHRLLSGRKVDAAHAVGGSVELAAGDARILLQDGVNLRFFAQGEKLPLKHQLLIEFTDFTVLTASVQMYGGVCAFLDGENDNPYYRVSVEKPCVLTDAFSADYFASLCGGCEDFARLSAKQFLATQQRIPGLGNGVLQDVLWNARIHPKSRMGELSDAQQKNLYRSVKETLAAMTLQGGRDTEKDLFGCPGGYRTILSKNTVGGPCPACGAPIQKEAYLGGSVYYCPVCQKYEKEANCHRH